MSWIERSIEERVARAARDGELCAPRLEGRPLADLDRAREPGWWANRFVERELSHDRRRTAEAAAAKARAGFWRAGTVADLHARVREANAAIARANINLIDVDRLTLFDPVDTEARWRGLRPGERDRGPVAPGRPSRPGSRWRSRRRR